MQATNTFSVQTSHGKIAVERRGEGCPILFIHGNSGSRGVFRKQFEAPEFNNYQRLALDLPGHGESADAHNFARTYTRPGLADAVTEVIEKFGLWDVTLVGHSLGGHVIIEMLAQIKGVRGAFLIGTPAVGTSMAEGFKANPLAGLASKAELTEEEARQFASMVFGEDVESFIEAAILRTDPNFRSTLFAAASEGPGKNQREVLASTKVPIAIVNGVNDQIIDLDYVDSVPYANLWRGKCFRVADSSHSPFWQNPQAVNLLLADFLKEIVP